MPCPTQPLLPCSCSMGDAQQLLDPPRKPGLQSMTWIFLSGLMGFTLQTTPETQDLLFPRIFNFQVKLMFQ